MAAALAHELNQPLTAVAGAVRAARRMLASIPECPPLPAEVQHGLELASEQSLLAGQIIKRLRAFVCRGPTRGGWWPRGQLTRCRGRSGKRRRWRASWPGPPCRSLSTRG